MANSELAERREFAYASIQNGIDTLSQPGVLPELRPGYQDEILGYLGNLVVPVLTPIVRNGVAGLEVNPTDAYNENSFTAFAGKAGESFFLNPSLLKQTDEQIDRIVDNLQHYYDYSHEELIAAVIASRDIVEIITTHTVMTFEGSFAAAITSHYFQSNLLPDKFPRLSLTNPHIFLARPIMQLSFEQGENAQTVSAAIMAHEADHALDAVVEPYELKSSTFVKRIFRELKAYHVSASVTRMMISDGVSTTKADRISLQIDMIRDKYTEPGELIPTGDALNAMLHEINDHKLLSALGIISDKQTP